MHLRLVGRSPMSSPTIRDQSDDGRSEEETIRRRDTALLRALSTAHKRQAEMKVGKPRAVKRDDDASRMRKRP